jgi:hypothetical protein
LGPALLDVVTSPEWDVADDLRAGRLVPLLASWHLPAADVVALLGVRTGRTVQPERLLEMLASPSGADIRACSRRGEAESKGT